MRQNDELVLCQDSHLYYSRRRFYLAESLPDVLPHADDVNPGQFGWIVGQPPREQGKVLLMGDIGSKSTWYDSKTNSGWRNDDVHNLFKKAAKILKKHLQFPIWGKNAVYNTKWELARGLKCSQGAADWALSGGELRQEGVKNVLFSMSPDSQPQEV